MRHELKADSVAGDGDRFQGKVAGAVSRVGARKIFRKVG